MNFCKGATDTFSKVANFGKAERVMKEPCYMYDWRKFARQLLGHVVVVATKRMRGHCVCDFSVNYNRVMWAFLLT